MIIADRAGHLSGHETHTVNNNSACSAGIEGDYTVNPDENGTDYITLTTISTSCIRGEYNNGIYDQAFTIADSKEPVALSIGSDSEVNELCTGSMPEASRQGFAHPALTEQPGGAAQGKRPQSPAIITGAEKMRIRTFVIAAILLGFSVGSAMAAQDIVAANPKSVKVEFQNAQVRVMRATIAPHKELALHEARDAVVVALTSYTVVHKSASGKTTELHRKRGEAVWVPGGERTIEAGAKPVEAIVIELKAPAAPK